MLTLTHKQQASKANKRKHCMTGKSLLCTIKQPFEQHKDNQRRIQLAIDGIFRCAK